MTRKAHFDFEKVVCRCQNKAFQETKGKIKLCEPLSQMCSSENNCSFVLCLRKLDKQLRPM